MDKLPRKLKKSERQRIDKAYADNFKRLSAGITQLSNKILKQIAEKLSQEKQL